jgi:hypothetical protein
LERLRGVLPGQDRLRKTVDDTIKVGNDLLTAKEFFALRSETPTKRMASSRRAQQRPRFGMGLTSDNE